MLNIYMMYSSPNRLITFLLVIFFTGGVTLLKLACNDSGTAPEEVNIVLPDSNLTFVDDISPLFTVKCAGSGCHSTTDRRADLDLTNYFEFESKNIRGTSMPLIIKGNGEQSPLYLILIDNYAGIPRMPFERTPLNENNTNGVRQWIDEDAPYAK